MRKKRGDVHNLAREGRSCSSLFSDSIAGVCVLLVDDRRLKIRQLEWLMEMEMCNPILHEFCRKYFQSHVEVQTLAKSFLANLDADTYHQAPQKLVWYYEKCLNRLGNYVEK